MNREYYRQGRLAHGQREVWLITTYLIIRFCKEKNLIQFKSYHLALSYIY